MYENCRYELHGLEKLFATGLSGVLVTGELFQSIQNPAYVKAEIARIRSHLIQKAFTFEDEGNLQRYIRFYQRSLIQICDEFFGKADSSPGMCVYEDIEEFLTFIEGQYPRYFDYDTKPPLSVIAAMQSELQRRVAFLEEKFMDIEADPILEIALFPLRKFLSTRSKSDVTYRTMAYLREVEKELNRLSNRGRTLAETKQEIHRVLYYLNYNFRRCFDYLIAELSGIIGDASTADERIERLAFIQKEVEQSAVKHGIGFDAKAVSLKSHVSSYLGAEIDYALHLQRSALKSPETPVEDGISRFRLKLDMSVSQTACLLKVMSDAGLIRNTNTAALIRFVSSHCETKRAERVSSSSFRIKFYNIEAGTFESVRKVLAGLANGMANMRGY